MSSAAASTVPDLLRSRHGDRRSPAYSFYADGRCDATTIAYGELHDQAQRIAASLLRHAAGRHVVIAMPTGPGFLRAFFASLYAGLVPVPIPWLRSGASSAASPGETIASSGMLT